MISFSHHWRVIPAILLFALTVACTTSSSVPPTSLPPSPMPVYSSSSSQQSSSASSLGTRTISLVSPDGVTTIDISAEIADTPGAQERGLMFRDHLEDNAGMLFPFDPPRALSFWMKNTLIPLDVIFFDVDGKFVSVSTMVPCVEDPCAVYRSGGPAAFALEVRDGFAEEKGIGSGWKLNVKND